MEKGVEGGGKSWVEDLYVPRWRKGMKHNTGIIGVERFSDLLMRA